MGKTRYLASCFLLLVILFAPSSFTVAEESGSDSLFLSLADAEVEVGSSWLEYLQFQRFWDQPSAPASGFSFPAHYEITSRYRYYDEDETAAAVNRVLLKWPSASAGVLTAKDRGEEDPLDLIRGYLHYHADAFEFIAGSYSIHHGLGGWLSSRPNWSAGYRGRVRSDHRGTRIIPNMSSEEGYGWTGIAGNYELRKFQLCIWSGFAFYDARQEESGWIIYSEQGNHVDNRSEDPNNLTEHLTGTTLSLDTRNHGLWSAGAWTNSWSEQLTELGQPTRFDRSKSTNSSFMISANAIEVKDLTLSAELSAQETGETAHLYSVKFPLNSNKDLVFYGYLANKEYSAIHSRSFLPFGGFVSGRSGLFTGLEARLSDWKYGGWIAAENQDEGLTQAGLKWFVTGPLKSNLFLILLGSVRVSQQEEELSWRTGRRSIRAHLEYEDMARTGLRFELSGDDLGHAFLAGGYHEESLASWLTGRVAASFHNHFREGATVSIIDGYIPGMFPVSVAGRDGIRMSALFAGRVWNGVEFWMDGIHDRPLEKDLSRDDDKSKWIFRAGLQVIQ